MADKGIAEANWIVACGSKLSSVLVIALPIVGLGIATASSLSYWYGIALPCGYGDCDKIPFDPSAYWLGVPVAIWGVAYYLALLSVGVYLVIVPTAQVALRTGIALLTFGLLASGCLVLLMRFQIGAICARCLGSAITTVALTLQYALVLWPRSEVNNAHFRLRAEALAGIGWLLSIGFAYSLVVAEMHRYRDYEDAVRRLSEVLVSVPASHLLNTTHAKGEVHATYKVVVFVDFFCAPCHREVEKLLRRQEGGEEFVLVLRHRPSSRNPLSVVAAEMSESAETWDEFITFFRSCSAVKSLSELKSIARRAGLERPDTRKLPRAVIQVRMDLELADRVGISRTPTFVLITPEGSITAMPVVPLLGTGPFGRH